MTTSIRRLTPGVLGDGSLALAPCGRIPHAPGAGDSGADNQGAASDGDGSI